ncbi:MAG TPA: hypothetical protein VF787_17700 [Thermoanaerobaculia bacterium]
MIAQSILPESVFRRARPAHELPDDLRLTALEWALYFAATGVVTAAELGRQFRVEPAERDAALVRLLKLQLIEEQPLAAADYVRALAAAGNQEEKTLREFLLGTFQTPTQAIAKLSAEPAPPNVRPLTALPNRQVNSTPAFPSVAPRPTIVPPPPGRVAPRLAFTPLPSPNDRKENRVMTASRKLSLRALMNLIETQAGSREAGQLDIYRVFVRVDTLLLKRSGIETLRFTEDRLVSDPELEQAIVRSVKKTLGVDCPESLWVEVA